MPLSPVNIRKVWLSTHKKYSWNTLTKNNEFGKFPNKLHLFFKELFCLTEIQGLIFGFHTGTQSFKAIFYLDLRYILCYSTHKHEYINMDKYVT